MNTFIKNYFDFITKRITKRIKKRIKKTITKGEGYLMPKIIKNIQQEILEKSRKLLFEEGYEAFTMRGVAKECSIAVGTLYNYYSSKEELIGHLTLDDWIYTLETMKAECEGADCFENSLRAVYLNLKAFQDKYNEVWMGYSFMGSDGGKFKLRHHKLVSQIAGIIESVLDDRQKKCRQIDIFLAENIVMCVGRSELEFESFLQIVKNLKL